ncbi:MAG TPA: hypothetical protein PK867_22815, partial [Pirellulales bacterium]|nr:hypothetical protein [Pirellulales bacterium]
VETEPGHVGDDLANGGAGELVGFHVRGAVARAAFFLVLGAQIPMFAGALRNRAVPQGRRNDVRDILQHEEPRTDLTEDLQVDVDQIPARVREARALSAGTEALARWAADHEENVLGMAEALKERASIQLVDVGLPNVETGAVRPHRRAAKLIDFHCQRRMQAGLLQTEVKTHRSRKKRDNAVAAVQHNTQFLDQRAGHVGHKAPILSDDRARRDEGSVFDGPVCFAARWASEHAYPARNKAGPRSTQLLTPGPHAEEART